MDAQAGDSRLLGWRAGQDEFFRTLVGVRFAAFARWDRGA